MAITCLYITDDQFEAILTDLNIEGKSDAEKQELVDRAVGDLEADLVERYKVPLLEQGGGDYSTAPAYARNKILNAIKAKIKALIGNDNNRNLIVESTERYINVHAGEYTAAIKVLLDPKKVFGFRTHSYTTDAVSPVQEVGLGRANNEIRLEDDPWVP